VPSGATCERTPPHACKLGAVQLINVQARAALVAFFVLHVSFVIPPEAERCSEPQ